MFLFKRFNQLLGAIWQWFICQPWIILAALFSTFRFIDEFINNGIMSGVTSLLFTPFRVLFVYGLGSVCAMETGAREGLAKLILSIPQRIKHFFTRQLPFGLKANESVSRFFKSEALPQGFDSLSGTGFFGRIVLKFLSLTIAPEAYEAYNLGNSSPHNSVTLFYTQQILAKLKQKYATHVASHKKSILSAISQYLNDQKKTIQNNVKTLKANPNAAGRLPSAIQDLENIKASMRCVERFKNNEHVIAPDINKEVACNAVTLLCYVWQAIETEATTDEHKAGFKEKLTLVLYQIQCGYNLMRGESGQDNNECPTGEIGLLARVIADEPVRMPGSDYTVQDASPTNLSSALKVHLDMPFVSSTTGDTLKRLIEHRYQSNPSLYKQQIAAEIKAYWRNEFGGLLDPVKNLGKAPLTIDTLDAIVDAGVEAWEPPVTQRATP